MNYEFMIFCLTLIAILALANGDKVIARQALNIVADVAGSTLQVFRQFRKRIAW